MKWTLGAIAVVALLAAYAVFGNKSTPSRVGAEGIDGRFFAMVHSIPHSKQRVTIDVYADFTCPACQRLELEGLNQIRKAYGERVIVRQHYLAGPASAPSAKILYDIAKQTGQGEVVAADLFAAKLKHGDDKANLPVVRSIAQRHQLAAAFEQSFTDGSGLAKLRAEWIATRNKITFFPFVVIDDDIAADADAENLVKIVGSLLKPAPPAR